MGLGPDGYPNPVQNLIYWVFAGIVVVALIAAVAVGGWMWIAPLLALVISAGYAVMDRRLKRGQSHEERLSSQLDPD
jgi:hypothetical protein